jgi:hypothetical protein
MTHLDRAISLYQEDERIKSLKIAYTLSDDRQEKQAIKISLLNLSHRIKQEKQG